MRSLLSAASVAMLFLSACSQSPAAAPTAATAPTATTSSGPPTNVASPAASPSAAVSPAPSPVAAASPQLPTAACTSRQLAASFVTGQGAAGTLFDTLALTNTSGLACTLSGFVGVQMLDSASNPLPTRGVPGGGMLRGQPGPSPFVLPPSAASQFVIAWSDVPVGGETNCPAAATLEVTPPADTTPLIVAGLSGIAPCNSGTIDISPLRAPGAAVP